MDRPRRSAAPWLYGLAGLLALLSPVIFLAVWVAAGDMQGLGAALLAAVADLVAAVIAAVAATVIAVRRGVTRVRTVVHGHPQGRAGRLAEHDAARWHLARDRFASLQAEYAAFEADRHAVAARPALADVTVPATARFVQAMGDAEFLATDEEPSSPRRAEFSAAVDRAAAAWEDAQRVAEGLAQSDRAQSRRAESPPVQSPPAESAPAPSRHTPGPRETRAVDPAPPRVNPPGSEYTQAADAVRRAAVRGAKDLRDRLRA